MFRNLFKRTSRDQSQRATEEPPEERFFSSIYGYPDIKKLLMRAIVSKEELHRSRAWAYKWLKRFDNEGLEGLKDR